MSDESRECFERFHANIDFARKLEEQFPEDVAWSCVVRFYAALHLINAYLIARAHLHFDPFMSSHVERKQAMASCPELRDAPKKFRELKDLSERIRYDAGFQYTPEHQRMSKAFLERIIAIVEPKLQR